MMLAGCSSYTENPEEAGDYELMDRATKFYEEQKYKEAFDLYAVLQKRHPDNPFYLIQMGHFKARLGETPHAIAYYQKALELQPDNPELIRTVALAFMFEGRYKQSTQLFQKLLQINPNDPDAWAGLGYIAMQKRRFDQAERYFAEALKIDPKHTNSLIYLGNLRTLQRRFDESRAIFQGLYKQEPDNPDVIQGLAEEEKFRETAKKEGITEGLVDVPVIDSDHVGAEVTGIPKESQFVDFDTSSNSQDTVNLLLDLAKMYRAQKRTLEGLEVNLRAYAIDPDNEEVGVQLGYGYLANGQPAKARQEFLDVLEDHPNSIGAVNGLAAVSFAIGDDKSANALQEQALAQDPQNSVALEQRANFLIEQRRYEEAAKDFKAIALYDPNNPSAEEGLLRVHEAPYLNQLWRAEQEKDDALAALAYEELLKSSPNNIEYLTGLAEIRTRQKRYPEAVSLYKRAVELAPDKNELWVNLGHAYVDNQQLPEARNAFQTVLNREPLNINALLGRGLVAQHLKDYQAAENDYYRAEALGPGRDDVQGYIGELRILQKRYKEAEIIFASLVERKPSDEWFQSGLKRARTAPWIELSLAYVKQEDYQQAIEIDEHLISLYPDDVDFYLLLAQVYVAAGQYDWAINIYLTALDIDPKNKDVLKGLGYAYLEIAFKTDMIDGDLTWNCRFPFVAYDPKPNAMAAHYYFESALEYGPDDSEIYAGLGKVADIYGCHESAEEFYQIALSLNPKDTAALAYYGELLKSERRYFYATDILGYHSYLLPEADYAWRSHMEAYRNTRPSAAIRGFYHQENQWDHFLHKQAARLQIYGGEANAIYPINEDLNVAVGIIDEYDVLKDFLNNRISYAINVQRLAVGFDYDYNPYLFFFGKFGVVYAHQYKNAFYPTQRKWLIQPSLGATYTRWNHRLTLDTFSVANIVEQDFNNPRSKLFSGQGIRGEYEYDFGKRRIFGFTANNIWYNDWIHNQAQYGATWVQWCPDEYWEYVAFRYQFSLGRFNRLTEDYYTYQAQTTHTLSILLTKTFLDGDLSTLLGYSHSWQRSFESGQQLVVTPVNIFKFLHREINYVHGQVDYRITPCIDVSFYGDYSKESFDYEIWNVILKLNWSF